MHDSGGRIAELLDSKRHVQLVADEDLRTLEPREEDFDEYRAFPVFRLGRRPQMMLSFRKCSGTVEKLAYSMMHRCYAMRPDEEFALEFGAVLVTVTGKHLSQVLDYIGEHRVPEIVEADRAGVMAAGEGECVIERIEIGLVGGEH